MRRSTVSPFDVRIRTPNLSLLRTPLLQIVAIYFLIVKKSPVGAFPKPP